MKTTNIKTLAAALAAIISVGVLTSCSANTAQTNPEPPETTIATTSQTTTAQPQTTSAKETTTPSSTKAETQTEKTAAPTSTAPATTAATSTTKPATVSTAPASTTTPAPEWTESAVSGTRYVNTAGIYSRSKAVLGAPTVKQYNLNDAVSVTAVTNTGYYKLSNGSFIHADYLGADKVTAQTASTTKPSTSSAAPTVSKPAATTKAQSSTTKPASTTKKQSTTTPSSGSSQSGGDWKGYDMDDPDFPWDEYLKETDGGGSNFNWDDLFGNTTMPWEDENYQNTEEYKNTIAYHLENEKERTEIEQKIAERTLYYLEKEWGYKGILEPRGTEWAMQRADMLWDNFEHSPDDNLSVGKKVGYYKKATSEELKDGCTDVVVNGMEAIAETAGFNVNQDYSKLNDEIDAVSKEIVEAYKSSRGHWIYIGDPLEYNKENRKLFPAEDDCGKAYVLIGISVSKASGGICNIICVDYTSMDKSNLG